MAAIRLTYRGVEYLIPETRAFAAGEAVENVVTLAEMAGWGANPRFFKLARAFGALVRFAGARVTDDEVHAEMMAALLAYDPTEDAPGEGRAMFAVEAITALQAVLMQAMPEATARGAAGKPGKPPAVS